MTTVCQECKWLAGDTDPSPCVKKKRPKNQFDEACKDGFEPWDGEELEWTPEQQKIIDDLWDKIYNKGRKL